MRRPEAPDVSSYYMARASRGVLPQEAEVIEAWMQILEDCDCEDEDYVNRDIEMEDEEMGPDREQAGTTEYLTQDFVTRAEIHTRYDRCWYVEVYIPL